MRRSMLCALAVGLWLTTCSSAQAAPLTLARYFDPANGIDEVITANAATTIDFANLDIVADFGVNRLSITSKETSGTSVWLDQWTVVNTALTGTAGVLSVQWSLDGTLTVVDQPSCPDCDSASIAYRSLFNTSGTIPAPQAGTLLASATQTGTGTTQVNLTDTILVPFIYGTSFNAGFDLSGSIGDDVASGSVSFFNSALITAVVLPDGASLVTSNTRVQYPVSTAPPQAVPEPASALLLGTSLAALVMRRRKR